MVTAVHQHLTEKCHQGKLSALLALNSDISKIADHADNCADIWVGKVEHGECFLQDQEDELEMPVLQQSPKEVQHDSNVFDIKSILEGLAEREISGQTRINL